MDIVTMILSLLCGVSLFLYGMSLMGDGLKRAAGDQLESFLYRMTETPIKGVLLGTAVTSVIQSSSATAVMVIGFVNAGMMKLSQAVGIIIGANIGTSVTGWILCLSYIGKGGGVATLLSSTTIAAVAAIAGTLLRMISKRSVHKNLGNILLGFAILMVGMQMMSSAVSPLKDNPAFTGAMTMFTNPLLGMLLGIVMTAILQSASASIGIMQALSVTGIMSFSMAFPIILGVGVGSSAPVLISSVTANKNGKRTAVIYLLDHVFGLIVWAAVFYSLNAVLHFPFMDRIMTPVSIAAVNSLFRIGTAICLFPFFHQLEKLSYRIIKDSQEDLEDLEDNADFDLLEERLLVSPPLAIAQSNRVIVGMSKKVRKNVGRALNLIQGYSPKVYSKVQRKEDLIDKYESKIGDYLVVLTKKEMNSEQTRQVTRNLRVIGDMERIGDYASNIARVMNEANEDQLGFSEYTLRDLNVLIEAEREIVNSTMKAYQESDLDTAMHMKPLSAAISSLCEIVQARHIGRVARGEANMAEGSVLNELLNSFERISEHCVAISGLIRRAYQENPEYHVHAQKARELTDQEYKKIYEVFVNKYDVVRAVERPVSVENE